MLKKMMIQCTIPQHVLMPLRCAFFVRCSEVFVFSVESFYFSDFRFFSFAPRHADVTDTTTLADGTRRIAVFLSLW